MRRVLIIDPYDDFREVLAEALEAEGVEIRCLRTLDVASATEWAPAVALVSASLFDQGVSARALRTALPSLRYVIGMTSDRHARLDAVVKPFNPRALVNDIEDYLARGERD